MKEFVKEFLAWAIPCMEHPEVYSEEIIKYKEKVWPKIYKECYAARETGELELGVLKAWYKAFPCVKRLFERGASWPMKDYMFSYHNELVKKISIVDEKILPCIALVGRVLEAGENVLVDVLGKKKHYHSKIACKPGYFVGLHLGEVVEILSKEQFEKYNGLIAQYGDLV